MALTQTPSDDADGPIPPTSSVHGSIVSFHFGPCEEGSSSLTAVAARLRAEG